MNNKKVVYGWIATIATGIIICALPTPQGLTVAGQRSLALMMMAAIMWLGELIPLGASSLLIIILAPMLGTMEVAKSFQSMANDIIFMYIGGFIVASAMAKYGLDRRIALWIIVKVGSSVSTIFLGLMLGSGFISLWLNNVTVVLCLLPIVLGILKVLDVKPGHATGKMFLFGLGYASLLGGIGTIIGTAPNALCVSFLKQLAGIEVTFLRWMLYGAPLAAITLVGTWWILTHVVYKVDDTRNAVLEQYVKDEYNKLGSMSGHEKWTFIVLALFVILLIAAPIGKQILGAKFWSEGTAGIAACMLLFFTGTIDWKDANKGIAWSVLLLFAAGITLSVALSGTGAAKWLAGIISGSLPKEMLAVGLSVFGSIFTQMTANTGATAILAPVAIATAKMASVDPASVAVPMTIVISYGFLTPVGSALNPLLYGQMPDGNTYIDKASDYFKAGFWPFIFCTAVSILYIVYVFPLLF